MTLVVSPLLPSLIPLPLLTPLLIESPSYVDAFCIAPEFKLLAWNGWGFLTGVWATLLGKMVTFSQQTQGGTELHQSIPKNDEMQMGPVLCR